MDVEKNDFRGLVADSVLELIGRTPVVRLQRVVAPGMATVWVKLERQNPGGCVKERIGLSMIEAAEREGVLKPGALIVEPTSGNTGIGLAMVAAFKGYRAILVMPDSVSTERRGIFKAYGAEAILTPGADGMKGAIAKAEEIVRENPNTWMPNQFANPANPEAHRLTTGPEILAQVPSLDAFVAGVGTGGTVTGIGRYLKAKAPHVRIFAVEPVGSPVLSGGEAGPHKIQGIGAGFVPSVFDRSVVDEILTVSSDEAAQLTCQLARREGLLVGISSGAAAAAALKIAARLGDGKTVVALLPDTGERYLSTNLFD
ncbi:MAG: cysteine synthase A [Anaerolineae bacterium]|nr:cysteine synthase A [Anaerolineae bacterium]